MTQSSEPTSSGAIDLAERLSRFDEHWPPRIVGNFNGHDLMLVKASGEVHMPIIEPAGTPNTGDPETAVHKPTL